MSSFFLIFFLFFAKFYYLHGRSGNKFYKFGIYSYLKIRFQKLNPQKELHHKTLIENGLNSYDYKNIREYLFELIPKVINISVETVDIFKELEKLN